MFRIICGTLLALALLASPAAAVERPFKLQGTTQIIGTPFAPGGARMRGVGQATHLGRWVNEGTLFFDGSTGPPFPALAIVNFTAANGDELDITVVGTLDPSGTAIANFYIVGGTGRFANASGGGDFSAHPNADGTLSYTAEGVIDY